MMDAQNHVFIYDNMKGTHSCGILFDIILGNTCMIFMVMVIEYHLTERLKTHTCIYNMCYNRYDYRIIL